MIALAAVAAAGCTTGQVGNPGPTSDTSSATTAASTPADSSRPKEIKLDGVDPCKVLTADQMSQLRVAELARNDSDIVKTGDVPTCDFTGRSPRITYGVALVTDKGIEYWRGDGNVEVEQIEVSGYPAVQLTLTGTSTLDCSVAVDVADGQQLYVDFSPLGEEPSQEQMCDNAKRAAGLALATLPTLV
ncbi:MAG: DUF3558 domain-containing protein [Saccharothrix sp.]|nr:DUF3558 domain-containing protein [Saccharothrix sp.]